uniref:Uncharacterized protein n=1 Tax=Populus trichocarpa TaxID=3694 RepID=A0A2K1Z277_POPTR
MAAVLAFDTSVTSKILPGGKGVVGSLFQAHTGTISSYEHISTVGCRKGCTASERTLSQEVALPHLQQAVTQ